MVGNKDTMTLKHFSSPQKEIHYLFHKKTKIILFLNSMYALHTQNLRAYMRGTLALKLIRNTNCFTSKNNDSNGWCYDIMVDLSVLIVATIVWNGVTIAVIRNDTPLTPLTFLYRPHMLSLFT